MNTGTSLPPGCITWNRIHHCRWTQTDWSWSILQRNANCMEQYVSSACTEAKSRRLKFKLNSFWPETGTPPGIKESSLGVLLFHLMFLNMRSCRSPKQGSLIFQGHPDRHVPLSWHVSHVFELYFWSIIAGVNFCLPDQSSWRKATGIRERSGVSGTRRRLRREVEVIVGGVGDGRAGLPVTLHSHPALISPRAQPPTMVGHLGQIALVFKNNTTGNPWCMMATWPWSAKKALNTKKQKLYLFI